MIRLYVGVENVVRSRRGALEPRRAGDAAVAEALDACREAGIFVCYNLLVFEPDATLADVRENIAFIRSHAGPPGELLPRRALLRHAAARATLAARRQPRRQLPRLELPHRRRRAPSCCSASASAAFRERNFEPDGVANRYMGTRLLDASCSSTSTPDRARARRAAGGAPRTLTRAIALETADFLEQAIDARGERRTSPTAIASSARRRCSACASRRRTACGSTKSTCSSPTWTRS